MAVDIDEDGFRERLSALVEALNGRESAARIAEMSVDQVGKWLRGDARPPLFPVARMALNAGRSLDWLILGGSETEAKVRFRIGAQLEEVLSGLGRLDHEDIVSIPIWDVRAAAGSGSWNERAETVGGLPFSARYLKRLGIDIKSVHGLRASGDSMFPTISDGALVLVDSSRREIVGDGIYAFVIDDFARIKRIQPALDGGLVFISDNAALYAAERLPRDQLETLEVVGRVFWAERIL
jgi:phage repressor protein C with HTH and peptisase S24 domain